MHFQSVDYGCIENEPWACMFMSYTFWQEFVELSIEEDIYLPFVILNVVVVEREE